MTNHENKKNRSAIAFKGGHRHNIGAPVIKAKNFKNTLYRLWAYLKYQKFKLLLVVIMVIVSSIFMLGGLILLELLFITTLSPRY